MLVLFPNAFQGIREENEHVLIDTWTQDHCTSEE